MNMAAAKKYEDLTNYELSMLDLAWEEMHPDESSPATAEDWKRFYESLPDDLKPKED